MNIKDVPFSLPRADVGWEPPSHQRAAVLAYLNDHPSDVFLPTRCGRLAYEVGVPEGTVALALWVLARHGLIGKARANGRVWYGSPAAIDILVSANCDAVRVV